MEEDGVSLTAEDDLDNAEPILTGVGMGLVKGLEGVMPSPLPSPFPDPSPCPSGCTGGSSTSLIVPSRQRMGGMASKGNTGEPEDNHDDDEEEEGLILPVVFVIPRSASLSSSLSFSLFADITCLKEGVAATAAVAVVAATMGLVDIGEMTLEALVARGLGLVAMIGGVMVVVTVLVVLAGVAVLTNGCRCCSRLDTAVVAGTDDEGDADDGDGRRAGTLSGG